jgi:N-acetylglucosamine kinase-like BadF-type ATPase
MRDALVIGVDAGGTTTRCALSDLHGTILARSTAGGANRNSSGGPPVAALTKALPAARGLRLVPPKRRHRRSALHHGRSAGDGR